MLDVGMQVHPAELLPQVQRALELAKQTGDEELHNCAESVLSALIRVLRSEKALIPGVLRPRIECIQKALDTTR
jgi:hypothetical protein